MAAHSETPLFFPGNSRQLDLYKLAIALTLKTLVMPFWEALLVALVTSKYLDTASTYDARVMFTHDYSS